MNRRKVMKIAAAMGCTMFGGNAFAANENAKVKNFIFINLKGGPSQFELFDAKKNSKNSGPTNASSTKIKDLYFNSTMPRLVELSDSMVVMRMTSPERDHKRGQYYLQSGGNRPLSSLKHPGLCSIVGSYNKKNKSLPPSVAIGHGQGSGYLGAENAPFTIENLDKTRELLEEAAGFSKKIKELEEVQSKFNKLSPLSDFSASKTQDLLNRKALALSSNSEFVKAIGVETEPVRTNYCPNMERQSFTSTSQEDFSYNTDNSNTFLAQCELAAEMIKIGVSSVQLELSGWDSHKDNFSIHRSLTSTLDTGVYNLVSSLKENGQFNNTLIYIAGEFGRSPKINKNEGREDFSRIFSSAVISGQVNKGSVLGETCKDGEQIKDAVSVAQASAAILTALGVNPSEKVNAQQALVPLKRKSISLF